MKYMTSDGDMLDMICWKYYGRVEGTVEAVLEANCGLADKGAVFPAGVKIELPNLSDATAETKTMRLWD
ncbi:MAG: phage tail protein [Desulfobacteraceae bacterium]|nr:phage tail protein [Desulfobacteraceae bacterium]